MQEPIYSMPFSSIMTTNEEAVNYDDFLSNLKNIVSLSAIVTTIGMYSSGFPICMKIRRKQSTSDVSPIPFIAGAACTGLWLTYGKFIGDGTLLFVNTVGCIFQLFSLFVYYRYCIQRSMLHKQLIVASFVLLAIAVIVKHLTGNGNAEDGDSSTTFLGLCASGASIIFCASPLSQLKDVVKNGTTENLPFMLIFVTFVCTSLWTLYGFLINDIFVKAPNILGMALAGIQLSLFVIYPKTKL